MTRELRCVEDEMVICKILFCVTVAEDNDLLRVRTRFKKSSKNVDLNFIW